MNFILWIVFGGIVGWLASLLTNTDGNIIWNIVVGIVGSLLGGWIADRLGMGGKPGPERPTNFWSFLWALVGAIILIVIINILV